MLRNVRELKNYTLRARDGEIGELKDFYFDDQTWTVRYLVVDTGAWLRSRRVLISPEALHSAEWDEKLFPIDLTKEQLRNSPPADSAQPVSRQYETKLREYYGWPPYWGAIYTGMPGETIPAATPPPRPATAELPGDPHLFGTNAVNGYHLEARDGSIGHVTDFLIEDVSWRLEYFVIDTKNWLPGRHVLLATTWIKHVDWATGKILIDLDRESVKLSPVFDPNRPVTVDYAARLQAHYDRLREHVEGTTRNRS